jgi:hypothetical protein
VGIRLDRLEAMALLKELVANNLIEPTFIHLLERTPNHFQIQIKCEDFRIEIQECAKKYGLNIEVDAERKYLVIFKP